MWASLDDVEACRVYDWEHATLFRKFPSPISFDASKVLLNQICNRIGLGCPPIGFLADIIDDDCVLGAFHEGTIYIRPWNNKTTVLHELAHYIASMEGEDGHGEPFVRAYIALLEFSGITICPDELARRRLIVPAINKG